MPKSKEAIFLNVYKDKDGKQTHESSHQEERDGQMVDVPNELLQFTRAMNRKARRAVAKANGTRICDLNSKKG